MQARFCESPRATASLTAQDTRAWIAFSPRGALVALRYLPEVHAVRCSLGVLSLRFEKLTFLCVLIGFPRTAVSSLHRSRIGIISPRVRLLFSNLGTLFDLLPERGALGLHRPTELNFEEWCSNHEWHQFLSSHALFFFLQNSLAMLGPHQLLTRIFNATCAEIFVCSRERCALEGETCYLQRRQVVCQRMLMLPLLCKVTLCSRTRLFAHLKRSSEPFEATAGSLA